MNLLHAYGGIERYCLEKRFYRTAAKARAACTRMERWHGVKLKPYRCPSCGHWHISRKRTV